MFMSYFDLGCAWKTLIRIMKIRTLLPAEKISRHQMLTAKGSSISCG